MYKDSRGVLLQIRDVVRYQGPDGFHTLEVVDFKPNQRVVTLDPYGKSRTVHPKKLTKIGYRG